MKNEYNGKNGNGYQPVKDKKRELLELELYDLNESLNYAILSEDEADDIIGQALWIKEQLELIPPGKE